MSNFYNYPSQFESIIATAKEAEKYLHENLEVSGLFLRKALEQWVHFIYENEPSLKLPYDTTIISLMNDNEFKDILKNDNLIRMMHAVRQIGNKAVHNTGKSKITESEALHALQVIHSISYYFMTLYSYDHVKKPVFDEKLIPASRDTQVQEKSIELQNQTKLIEKLQVELQERAELEKQLLEIQKEREATRKESQQTTLPPIDPDEAKTRELLIDYMLEEAGWDLSKSNVKEFRVDGMPNNKEEGYADYVLWGDDGKPLAVVEAKRSSKDENIGRHQAELYAKCLEKTYGQLPNIFLTKGYEISFYDWNYPIRKVHGYYNKEELQLNIQRRNSKHPISEIPINEEITERYYQIEAIRSVAERLEERHRGALLVMATGTGKTRTAASLIDVLSQANWVKRVLFLADRTALVTQAQNAINEHLPNLPTVNLLQNKEETGSRIVFSTYQTLINLIDNEKTEEEGKLYGVGHFDLIIFDEIHRSIYNRYKAIFNYFDGLKIGLTATPVDFADRNTYDLFGLDVGNPTYNYDLDKAIDDGYLVPYRSISVGTKFQREGIKYADLSEEEKLEYEEKFGDPITGEIPDEIESSALDQWIYNTNTADAILEYLMENGLKVDNGNKIGKTIIFAKKHDHAEFLRKRFNVNYPEYNDQFLKVIDYQVNYAEDLINDFKGIGNPQIACSVDMLDTGIDVPEILNLVFLKPVKSRVKFWQMIGRGTRLRKNLFGHEDDKEEFLILDFCQNFEYFQENPRGTEANRQISLAERLFTIRLQISQILLEQSDEDLKNFGVELINYLHAQTTHLYLEKQKSFIVRPHLRVIEKYQDINHWKSMSKLEYQEVIVNIAHLVVEKDPDSTALSFDLFMYDFMMSNIKGHNKQVSHITKLANISNRLQKQKNIPQVNAKIGTLKAISDENYWKDISCLAIDHIRMELRNLIKFLPLESRGIVYTSLADEITSVEASPEISESKSFDKEAYKVKVEQFIRENKFDLTIDKIRKNIKITKDDLAYLENFLFEKGSLGSKELFKEVFGEQPLGEFIRSVVGLDKTEAKNAFSKIVNFANLNAQQIQFMDVLINYFSVNGILEIQQLFHPPFSDVYSGGIVQLFGNESAKNIADTIIEINGNCMA